MNLRKPFVFQAPSPARRLGEVWQDLQDVSHWKYEQSSPVQILEKLGLYCGQFAHGLQVGIFSGLACLYAVKFLCVNGFKARQEFTIPVDFGIFCK